jgi:hypothetical protein
MAETVREGMVLGELDVLVFLKSPDNFERTAERVFAALRTPYEQAEMEDPAGVMYYEANGLGFHAAFYPNQGELLDPEFEEFGYGLEITSQFWCVEMDTLDLEGPLSEYYARLLTFDLDLETSTEIFLETTEEAEIFEIRSYRRNPQFRLDQGPTTPKVFVVEARQVERRFEEEDWEEGADGAEEGALDVGEGDEEEDATL